MNNYTWLAAVIVATALALSGCATETASSTDSHSNASAVADEQAAAAASSSASAAEVEAAAESAAQAEASAKAEEEAAAAERERIAAEKKAKEAEKKSAAAAQKKLDNAEELSARELSLVVKRPDDHVGDVMVVYGNITQFDAATGTCIFRANIAHTNMADTWDYEHNSMFAGGDGDADCELLDDFVTDDEVRITATSLGSFSYDTQIGGNTTVPMFNVEKITLTN